MPTRKEHPAPEIPLAILVTRWLLILTAASLCLLMGALAVMPLLTLVLTALPADIIFALLSMPLSLCVMAFITMFFATWILRGDRTGILPEKSLTSSAMDVLEHNKTDPDTPVLRSLAQISQNLMFAGFITAALLFLAAPYIAGIPKDLSSKAFSLSISFAGLSSASVTLRWIRAVIRQVKTPV